LHAVGKGITTEHWASTMLLRVPPDTLGPMQASSREAQETQQKKNLESFSTWVPLMGFWIHDLWCHRHGGEVDTHESGRSPSSVTVTVVVPDILTSRRTRFCFKVPPNRDTVDKESPYGCLSVMVKGIVYVIPA
ncbi:hypothetical protein NEUTE1DRAFT_41760, partial [Neurospora tetrasperma FGSC 2508]